MRWVDYPQDVLLADLGRASRLYPDLDDALRARRGPTEMRLDTAGAYRFLTHATVLAEAGFGVLLPAQWQRRQEFGLTLTVHSGQPAQSGAAGHHGQPGRHRAATAGGWRSAASS